MLADPALTNTQQVLTDFTRLLTDYKAGRGGYTDSQAGEAMARLHQALVLAAQEKAQLLALVAALDATVDAAKTAMYT